MMGETNLFGVFFSGALAAACLACVALLVFRQVLLRAGFYQLVWHRHLVDLALFAILWAAAVKVMPLLAGMMARAG
jgi:Protein of unknown function (DUF1656)